MLEIRNYWLRIKSPIFAYHALVALFNSVCWAIARRTSPGWIREISIPEGVVRARQTILGIPIGCPSIAVEPSITKIKLKLAVDWFTLDTDQNWDATFSDPEVTTSLHRWGWLLHGITDAGSTLSRQEGLDLMRSWLAHCMLDENFSRDPYSASERIVNSGIFLLTSGDKSIPTDIQLAFRYMSREIASHLEYFEADRAGNHAFNNGRGLFFAGVLADSAHAIELAWAIFRERLPKLLTADGFLREASSHYHFLLTRWVLEVRWLAVLSNHNEIADFLRPYARRLVERCWFFLIKNETSGEWSIPLIGDISPDFQPNWLLSVPWSNPALEVYNPVILPENKQISGWASIFGMDHGQVSAHVMQSHTYPNSFWHRIVHGDFVLFVHAEAQDGTLGASHRHSDLTSFVLYRAGDLVLNDCGRASYMRTDLGEYGRSGHSHNALFVENLPAVADAASWYQRAYTAVSVQTKLHTNEESSQFILRHNGFERLANISTTHERQFTLRNESFELSDQLTGIGSANIMLRLHLAPGLRLQNRDPAGWHVSGTEATLTVDKLLHCSFVVGQYTSPVGGFSSAQYGETEECCTMEMRGKLTLPINITNKLNWG